MNVTPSCGCVFCDLGLEPDWLDAVPLHYLRRDNKYVECTNPENMPSELQEEAELLENPNEK